MAAKRKGDVRSNTSKWFWRIFFGEREAGGLRKQITNWSGDHDHGDLHETLHISRERERGRERRQRERASKSQKFWANFNNSVKWNGKSNYSILLLQTREPKRIGWLTAKKQPDKKRCRGSSHLLLLLLLLVLSLPPSHSPNRSINHHHQQHGPKPTTRALLIRQKISLTTPRESKRQSFIIN